MNNQRPSADAVRGQLVALKTRITQNSMDIRAAYKRAEEGAKAVAADADLRVDAKAKRQASLRATVGHAAMPAVAEAHAALHRATAEAERRTLPEPSKDAGQAVRDRAVVEQLVALEEGQLAARLQTDAGMRNLLFSSATPFELERVQKNPALDFQAIKRQTQQEYAPMMVQRIDELREAAVEGLRVAGRAVGAGLSGERVELDGLMPNSARRATEIADRLQNLDPGWTAESDPMFEADRQMLEGRIRDVSGGAA